MSRYLLDTDIISNITKPVPSESLMVWMAEQIDENLFVTSLTVAEFVAASWKSQPAGSGSSLTPGFPARKVPRRCLPAACCHSTKGPP